MASAAALRHRSEPLWRAYGKRALELQARLNFCGSKDSQNYQDDPEATHEPKGKRGRPSRSKHEKRALEHQARLNFRDVRLLLRAYADAGVEDKDPQVIFIHTQYIKILNCLTISQEINLARILTISQNCK